MLKFRNYTVVPALPKPLTRLRELANNLWWSWNGDAQELFRRLEPDLWNDISQNPVWFIAHVSQRRLNQAADDRAFTSHLDRVMKAYDEYMGRETWFTQRFGDCAGAKIAYFSMEFGLHESLPIYSGGLGVLAGDHLKSASDLGVPLIGIGLFYRQGYFTQRLSADGWQIEEYPSIDVASVPVSPVLGERDEPVSFEVPVGNRNVRVQSWQVHVGRVTLYLLDTDLPQNDPADREITQRLYGGDEEMRIRQEVVLGIGGLRLLAKLGVTPSVCHMNEGHSAFLAVERIRERMEKDKLSFSEAREAVVPSNIFTTHTPVPAGIDQFAPELLKEYLDPYLPGIGLSSEDFANLGKKNGADPNELFNMAVLALRLSGFANGVSALHGHVSRELWQSVWPGAPRDEVPITSITNGIHTRTWMSPEMQDLLNRYLGPHWSENPVDHDIWLRVSEIPDMELWRTHERRRVALVQFARHRTREQLRRRGAPPTEIKGAEDVLDPEALTIGFARRFAPYKRGALLFRDPQRLLRLITDQDRPVQFVFAGKSHPRDGAGKELIKQITTYSRKAEFRRRIVFLENYDMSVARKLVQGCDVWLNNPIKPREASGTSGMKVPPNGGINLSVLDGWWPEAYDGENGWAIGDGQVYEDPAYQDYVEGEAIYDLLEKEIIPMFYDRGEDGLPRRWITRVKASMRTICPMFNTNRMIEEYASRLYVPALRRWQGLASSKFAAARELAKWKQDLGHKWTDVKIERVEADDTRELPVGSFLTVRAAIRLGGVKPEDVAVELYHGRVDPSDSLVEGASDEMKLHEKGENGTTWFVGKVPCIRSGQHRFAVRVVPRHEGLPHRFDTGMILWG